MLSSQVRPLGTYLSPRPQQGKGTKASSSLGATEQSRVLRMTGDPSEVPGHERPPEQLETQQMSVPERSQQGAGEVEERCV